MDSKIKILIGVLVVGLILIGGKLIWNLSTCRDICYGNKVQPQVPTAFGFDCASIDILACSKKCGAECETHKDCPEGFICNFENCKCIPEIQSEEQVTIATDKTEYEQGEIVKIIVKNNMDKPIWYYDWCTYKCDDVLCLCGDSFFIEKKGEGKYKAYYSSDSIGVEHMSKLIELKPGSKRIYQLELVKFSEGTYRLGMYYGFSKNVSFSEGTIIYSNEFTIGKGGKEETSDWKTYTNKDYGFEIKYPKGNQCEFSEIEEGSFLFGRIELNVINSKGLNLDDYVEKFIADNDLIIETRETTSVANREGIKLTYRFGGTNRYGEVTFVKNNGNIYAIGYTGGTFLCNEPEIFSKMLSTFRFLE